MEHIKKDAAATSYFSHFYDVTEHFAKRFDKVGRQLAFKGRSRQEALAWQKKFTTRLGNVLGMDTFEMTKLRPQLHGKEDRGTHWREDWTIYTEPDVIAPFYALVPKNIKPGEKRAAVICPHGHGSGGRYAPAGRGDLDILTASIKRFNYDYAVKLAERGFITFAMDARGFGQRRIQHQQLDKQDPNLFLNGSCHELMIMGHPLGQTITGMWTWDLMRLVDYLQTRPEIDSKRIGCGGLSGGGLQTLYFAALDKRIQASVVSGYYYGVKDALIRCACHCDCNCVPNLWKYADMGDVGGLIAPRGLLIETGDKDPLNGKSGGMRNVTTQVGYTRRVYKALACRKQLVHHVFCGEHRWCGEQAEPWLEEQLQLR